MRRAVQEHPESVEPFLQLGNLLRIRGDAERAAVLHRGLTVRNDLPRARKVLVGLALVEDLLALQRWHDARATLDTISADLQKNPRYWMARFRQWYGLGDLPNAARALKHSLRHVADTERPALVSRYVSFQLDRALEYALSGDEGAVSPRLKDVVRYPEATVRISLVKSLLAAAAGDAQKALSLAAEGLMESPRELGVLLPFLQDVLLKSGQYARSIPLLESACQAENAPPSLWVDLALLYEKLGQREQTLRLVESKSGSPEFTPDVAAPLLRLLFHEAPVSDARTVWSHLGMPRRESSWHCLECGRLSSRVRWFCPDCEAFDSYALALDPGGEA